MKTTPTKTNAARDAGHNAAGATQSAHVFRNSSNGWLYRGDISSDGSTTFGKVESGDKASFYFPSENSECELMEDVRGFFEE